LDFLSTILKREIRYALLNFHTALLPISWVRT